MHWIEREPIYLVHFKQKNWKRDSRIDGCYECYQARQGQMERQSFMRKNQPNARARAASERNNLLRAWLGWALTVIRQTTMTGKREKSEKRNAGRT